MASIARRPDGQWRARYRDAAGKEHARHFKRQVDAKNWLRDVDSGRVSPDKSVARMTVADWCDTWLAGYLTRRASTVGQARVHIRRIKAEFGTMPVAAVRPSQVKAWTARLREEGLSASYVHRLHVRLAQIMGDAVNDGIIARSPCSRRTSPGAGQQRPYVATTEQVWALADAMPERLRAAVLLAAFAGLRISEASGLRVGDVDFMRGVVSPAVQYPAEELKSETARTPVPIPRLMTLELASHVSSWPGVTVLTDEGGAQLGPWMLDRAFRAARGKVAGLPDGFRYHDLRHYFASLLIASGCDVKTVQARLRHKSATTTLNVYGHLWPDRDESTRAAVEAVFAARADSARTAAATS